MKVSTFLVAAAVRVPLRAPFVRMLDAPPPDDDNNLALLSRRINELKAVDGVAGLCLREVLLPGQRMRIQLMPTEYANLLNSSSHTVGVLGTFAGDGTSSRPVCTHGVEAHVSELQREFNDAGYGDAYRWSATLTGGRVFERQDVRLLEPGDTFFSEVRWLDLGLSDTLSAARSPSRAVSLAARELDPLVKTWLELARGGGSTLWGKPRAEAQPASGGVDPADGARRVNVVDRMLEDLGEMPPIDRPSERALWVAALINPCGADRDAWPVLDIKPAVLTARTPVERLSAAKKGLVDSIYKLKGGNWPMDTYYW